MIIMKSYSKEQLEELNNVLKGIKQSADINIPIDYYRNSELNNKKTSCQNQFFF